jgi:hypothetical protein
MENLDSCRPQFMRAFPLSLDNLAQSQAQLSDEYASHDCARHTSGGHEQKRMECLEQLSY